VIAYWRERFDLVRFGPAAALLAMAAAATGGGSLADWGTKAVLALCLVAQFRLWDDLADRGRDRRDHPERVLVTAQRAWPFIAQAVALAAINLVLVHQLEGRVAAVLVLSLNAAAVAYYLLRGQQRTASSDLLLLAKYPAFVLILSGAEARAGRVVLAIAITYAAACAFEVWHDASGPLRVNQS
jgi:4-hydroxybenzoate polyprenyltransferase